MRIGIDLLGVQSPHSRGRGIGRYATSLVTALLDRGSEDELLLYVHSGFPAGSLPWPNSTIRPMPDAKTPEAAVDQLARTNPDHLDTLLLLSPFEVGLDYAPPAKPLNRLAMIAVVYDLLPFVFQERHLTHPPSAMGFYRNLERLRRYDALLAISEATRTDLHRLLGGSAVRIKNIQGASDSDFFTPPDAPWDKSEAVVPKSLGIDRPFILSVASADPRKNLLGLLDAFCLLDEATRKSHRLVVTCLLNSEDRARIEAYAEKKSIKDSLILTGEVSDTTLRWLYQHCSVFAFPSLYEGLGLPILEAMHCRAAVIAGRNSSQPEFVGSAGLLVNAHDSGEIADHLDRLLKDPAKRSELGTLGIEQAKKFSWANTADLALNTIRSSRPKKLPSRPRRRIAMFSPWPPKASGIADYASRLIHELRKTYSIDIYHDAGYEPDIANKDRDFSVYDHCLFRRNAAIRDYHAIVYQMGNSLYHQFVYRAMLEQPGIVTLHDFGLASFHHGLSHQEEADPKHFQNELQHSHPDRAASVMESMDNWIWNEGNVQDAFASRKLSMNRSVFDAATCLLSHSRLLSQQVTDLDSKHLSKVRFVTMGCSARQVSRTEVGDIRRRFGIPEAATVFGSFGILHPSKLNLETISAFGLRAREFPNAHLIFVGQDLADGESRRHVEALGLSDRIRFLGRQDEVAYADLIAATDVGICLRRPPTNGETSAALLDLLRHGIPTIVSETGTFLDYPDHVVRRIPWTDRTVGDLADAMLELFHEGDGHRQEILNYVAEHHSWEQCAAGYIAAIEEMASRGNQRLAI